MDCRPSKEEKFPIQNVNVVLGKIPSWITRSGTLIILVIFFGLILGCYLVKYPEKTSSKIVIKKVEDIEQYNRNFSLFGEIIVPQNKFDKIKKRQIVHIKLDAYPYIDYGLIAESVDSIYIDKKDGNIIVLIKLPQEVITTYQKNIFLIEGLEGNADIIFKDITLLDRIIEPIKGVFRKG